MELLATILRRIVHNEGPGIFQEPYRFWAIAEDLSGGREKEEVEFLLWLAQRNLLPTLGRAFQAADDGERQRLVREVEQRLTADGPLSGERTEELLNCFCQAYGWNIELAVAQRRREAREQAERARQEEAARRQAEEKALAERRAREEQAERDRIAREQRDIQRKQALKWVLLAVVLLATAALLAVAVTGTVRMIRSRFFGHSGSGYSSAEDSGSGAVSIPTDAMTYDGHSYRIYNIRREGLESFWEAEDFCESMGGHLAVINDEAENRALYDYVQDSGLTLTFFGYTDEASEGDWKWVTGKSSYENWAFGQPNNGANNEDGRQEHYAEFYKNTADGTWNDAPFGANTYHFICEWEET